MDYKLKINEVTELKGVPNDEKVIVQTQTMTETSEFTLGEKKRQVASLDTQIASLQTRKQELLDLIDSVSSSLNLST